MHQVPLRPAASVAAVLAPLLVVTLVVALSWPWWSALAMSAAAVAVVSQLAGAQTGLLSAMLALSGFVLVVERDQPTHNGLDLVGMAVLLVVALVFGIDRPAD